MGGYSHLLRRLQRRLAGVRQGVDDIVIHIVGHGLGRFLRRVIVQQIPGHVGGQLVLDMVLAEDGTDVLEGHGVVAHRGPLKAYRLRVIGDIIQPHGVPDLKAEDLGPVDVLPQPSPAHAGQMPPDVVDVHDPHPGFQHHIRGLLQILQCGSLHRVAHQR